MEIYNWNEYLDLPSLEKESNWIIDSHGISWTVSENVEEENLFDTRWFQAERVSPEAKVMIVNQSETTKSSPEANFYLKFFMLDFEAPETVRDFMITYGFNYGQNVFRDKTSKSIVFTIDHLASYHEVFKKNLIVSLHQAGKLSAKIVQEKITQEIEVVEQYKKKKGRIISISI